MHSKKVQKLCFTFLVMMGCADATHPLIGQTCVSDTQCLDGGWEYCKPYDLADKKSRVDGANGFCQHKDVFPMKPMEFWGMLVVIGILWITNIGGVGGAGIQVPICMIFFKFDAKNAVAINYFSIFISALMRWIINSQQSHPLKNGTGILVDMNLSMIMLPPIVSGVSFGVILNLMLPNIVIIIAYVVALTYFGIGVAKKAQALYKKEVERDAKVAQETLTPHIIQDDKANVGNPSLGAKNIEMSDHKLVQDKTILREHVDAVAEGGVCDEKKGQMSKKLNDIIAYESTNLQWSRMAQHWGLIIILIVICLLRGTDKKEDSLLGLEKCEPEDWVLFSLLQVFCIAFLIVGVVILKKDYKDKTEAGYEFVKGDFEATPKSMMHMAGISFFGAIYAAFSGLGPGMYFVPTLIMIGIEQRVGAATGMYLTMFTSLAATIQVIIFKKINLEYALYVNITTVIGTFLGVFFQRYIVQKFNRVSYTNFFFVTATAIAIISTVVINIPLTIHRSELGEGVFAVSQYCPKSE